MNTYWDRFRDSLWMAPNSTSIQEALHNFRLVLDFIYLVNWVDPIIVHCTHAQVWLESMRYALPLLSNVIRYWDPASRKQLAPVFSNYSISHVSLCIHNVSHFARSDGVGSTARTRAMRANVGRILWPRNIIMVRRDKFATGRTGYWRKATYKPMQRQIERPFDRWIDIWGTCATPISCSYYMYTWNRYHNGFAVFAFVSPNILTR